MAAEYFTQTLAHEKNSGHHVSSHGVLGFAFRARAWSVLGLREMIARHAELGARSRNGSSRPVPPQAGPSKHRGDLQFV